MSATRRLRQPLAYYLTCFAQLNCNRHGCYTAPHKAVLLLAVIEGVRTGFITNGFVPLGDRMEALCRRTWERYVGLHPHYRFSFATPFYHMANEPFWDLLVRPGALPVETGQTPSNGVLYDHCCGAIIPEELCDYMAAAPSRDRLIRVLTQTWLGGRGSLRPLAPTGSEGRAAAAEAAVSYGNEGTSDVA